MKYTYKTILRSGNAVYKEKGSRFLAFTWPVGNEAEIKERLTASKSSYFDARHHCYAWILGSDASRTRANDDGEPNHSAGDPILAAIRSRSLTNVLVVVVRYFGGTKLGVGGLITAYRTAAEEALEQSGIIEKEVRQPLELHYPYEATTEVNRLIRDFKLEITAQQFDAQCLLLGTIGFDFLEAFQARVSVLQATGTQLTLNLLPVSED